MNRDEIMDALSSVDEEPEYEAAERWVRPLADTAHSLTEQLASDDERFRFGIAAIDLLTRGIGAKELCILTGFAHAGKTQLVLTALLHNPDKRVLFFSLDDPAEMLLLKLAAMQHKIPGDKLETMIRQGDGKSLVEDTVTHFPNLLIVDDSIGVRGMTNAEKEAEAVWGAPPDLVVVDYLELLGDVDASESTVDDSVKSVAKRLKRHAKGRTFPLLVLHQNTRSRGAPGEPINMLSMAHGGEQEATIVIGVRRKRDNEKLDHWEREAHAHTVSVHVPKNKRPPARITPPEGVDLFIDPFTGYIRPLRESDYRPGLSVPKPTQLETAEAALAEARRRQEELA